MKKNEKRILHERSVSTLTQGSMHIAHTYRYPRSTVQCTVHSIVVPFQVSLPTWQKPQVHLKEIFYNNLLLWNKNYNIQQCTDQATEQPIREKENFLSFAFFGIYYFFFCLHFF